MEYLSVKMGEVEKFHLCIYLSGIRVTVSLGSVLDSIDAAEWGMCRE